MAGADDASALAAEVVTLHEVIEAWLAGTTPRSATAFARFADALAPGFTLCSPDGAVRSRDEVVASFEPRHGLQPGLTIEIRGAAVVRSTATLGVVRYEEWQRAPQRETARASLVVLERAPGTASGWRWLALHEAWLPGVAA